MLRRPPRSTRTDTLFPYTTLFRSVITETDQNQVPSYIFVSPRHVLRTRHPSAVRLGMVVRTQNGEVFIVGDNGPGEHAQGILRSEERRVGTGCVRKCRSRWSRYP